MAPVLFVAYGGGHVAALAPVYAALLERGIAAEFLALTTARSYLQQRGLPCIGFADCPGADDPQVRAWGEQLWRQQIQAGAINSDNPSVSQGESIAYLGLNFRDLVDQWGEEDAARRFAQLGRQTFEPTRTLCELLVQGGYGAVVATSAPRAEKAAIEAAGQLGLPTLCLVDLFATQEVQWLQHDSYATQLCVISDSVKQTLIAAGRSAATIAVTGNPAFDALQDPAHRQHAAQLSASWKRQSSTRVILWASQVEPPLHPITGEQGDPQLPRRVEQRLLQRVARDPDQLLIIRPHPSEPIPQVEQAGVRVCSSEVPIEPLLHLADVVVTLTSTVGLQAWVLGKPVAAVRLSVFEPDSPLAALGLTTGVEVLEDLDPLLDRLLQSHPPEQERRPGGMVGRDVRAIDRVMQALHDLGCWRHLTQ